MPIDGVDLRDVFTDFVAVALDQAAGDDDASGHWPPCESLCCDHFQDGVDGLLLGRVDEGAGVDDDDVGVLCGGGELGAVVMEEAHHDSGVDEIFRAAEGDEADPGARLLTARRGGLVCVQLTEALAELRAYLEAYLRAEAWGDAAVRRRLRHNLLC